MTVPNVQWKTKILNEGILKFQKDLKMNKLCQYNYL